MPISEHYLDGFLTAYKTANSAQAALKPATQANKFPHISKLYGYKAPAFSPSQTRDWSTYYKQRGNIEGMANTALSGIGQDKLRKNMVSTWLRDRISALNKQFPRFSAEEKGEGWFMHAPREIAKRRDQQKARQQQAALRGYTTGRDKLNREWEGRYNALSHLPMPNVPGSNLARQAAQAAVTKGVDARRKGLKKKYPTVSENQIFEHDMLEQEAKQALRETLDRMKGTYSPATQRRKID